MDKNIEIMDEIMGGITQTHTWITEQMQNPEILEAQNGLSKALEPIRGTVPDDVVYQIEDAAYHYASAFEDAAILYGIHVADAIRDVAARPSDLSRHILVRLGKDDGDGMSDKIRIIEIEPEDSAKICAAVDMARARFPERFAGMDDDEVLNELIRIGLKSKGVTA